VALPLAGTITLAALKPTVAGALIADTGMNVLGPVASAGAWLRL